VNERFLKEEEREAGNEKKKLPPSYEQTWEMELFPQMEHTLVSHYFCKALEAFLSKNVNHSMSFL